jgi:superfamily II DNA or RNA helicase
MLAPIGMDLGTYRPGQYSAHLVIYERVQAREPYTTTVLPTRYGKTDVIRATAIHLWRDDLICNVLVLSPGVTLRDQVTNAKQWEKFIARYHVDMTGIRYRSLPAKNYIPEVNFAANGELLISVSMPLVNTNVAFFQRWVQSRQFQTGKPVLIYIDEAHTGSEDNSWGQTVQKLVQAGALAVLCTATPYRSDGKKPVGFPCEEIDATETFHYITSPTEDPDTIHIKKHHAIDRTWRLIAHHETSFREAWDESIIANVSRVPFDVNLSEIALDGELESGVLSTLSQDKTRRYLDRLCRDPLVMREGIRRFVEQLHIMNKLAPCAGIIFCGNDKGGSDRQANAHAQRLQALIHDQETWEVIIATSANPDDEAEMRIKQFADPDSPVGDVLIVKQMAGCGLDVPRLKVILDLSPIRTEAAWIQRIMRAATLYAGLPAVYISPDDCFSRALFDRVIAEQGGEAKRREIGAIVHEYDKKRTPSSDAGLYVEDAGNADFQDNLGREGERSFYELVQFFAKRYPGCMDQNTHAGLAEDLQQSGFKVQSPVKHATDTTLALAVACEQANTKVEEIVRWRLRGHPYDQASYRSTITAIWVEAYQRAGVAPGMRLQQIADLDCLQRLNRILAHIEAQERASHATH